MSVRGVARSARTLVRFAFLAAALIAGAAFSDTASAQTDTITSIRQAEAAGVRLLGVYDAATGAWIDHATVRDTLGGETVTSKIGVATLNALTPIAGFYMIEVRKEGYAPRRLMLRADGAESMTSLEPNPLGSGAVLPTVVVTDRRRLIEDAGLRRGFFDRCQVKGVSCIGRRVLDLHPVGGLSDLLSHVEGVHRDCLGADHGPLFKPEPKAAPDPNLLGCLVQMRPLSGTRYCTPTYYINGFEWNPLDGTSQAQIDQFLSPSHIEGIEVYLATTPHPARFDGGAFSDCGAIVIWTR